MNIIICGDTAPTNKDSEKFSSGIATNIVSMDIAQKLNNADFTVLNLETPICSKQKEIEKCGPCLYIEPSVMSGLKALSPSLVTLANNHIMDQDVQGLHETEALLSQIGIDYFGVGDTLEQAAKPYIKVIDNIKLGIYACAEREFSIAEQNIPGANPFDPLYSLDHIKELSKQCDYVIVLYHGGKEHYRYPSPNLQKACQRMVEKGADLVVCQHSHCIGCKEEYKGGNIVYGQGNFIFADLNNEFWHSGLILSIDVNKTNDGITSNIDYIPIVRTNDDIVVLPDDKESKEILNAFLYRSEEIKKDGFLNEKYKEFARKFEMYLDGCQGKKARFRNKVIAHLPSKMQGFAKKNFNSSRAYNKVGYLALQNFIECEAHRELFIEFLKDKIKNCESKKEK